MQTRVQKWGNSLAVRLPKALADEVRVTADSPVEVTVKDNEIILRPLRPEKTYALDDLLTGVTAENRHGEEDFGPSLGREVW